MKLTKKYTFKKKTNSSKPVVKSLVTQVAKIKKQLKQGTEIQHLYGSYSTTVAADYYALNLCNYNALVGCFGSSGNDYNFVNKWKSNYFLIDLMLNANNEPNDVNMSLYIVSLKDSASRLYDKASGVLTLASVNDYIMNTASSLAQTLVNPKEFNVHWSKKLIIGNNNIAGFAPTGTGDDTVKNTYRKLIKIRTGHMVYNPISDVKSLTCDQDPSKQYYLLVFNDNIATDVESPSINVTLMHSITVAV